MHAATATHVVPLQAGDCRLTLTRTERELLHHLLAIAQEQPAVFGGTDTAEPGARRYLVAAAARIAGKLPRRGSGCYD